MDEDTILDNHLSSNEGLTLSSASIEFLRVTAKWAGFLAIVGFVMIGIMVLVGIFAGSFIGQMASMSPTGSAFPIGMSGTFFTIFYLLFAALYFFPVLYLYRFAKNTKAALKSNDSIDLENALQNLSSHYKFIGILFAIILGFYALIIVFGVIGAVIGMAM